MRAGLGGGDVHKGTQARITSHRLLWHAVAADGWLALRLDGVASASIEAAWLRSKRCTLRLRAGGAVTIVASEDARTEDLCSQLRTAVSAARWREGSYEVTKMGGLGRILGQRDAQRQQVAATLDVALTDLSSLKQHAALTVAAARQVSIGMSGTDDSSEGSGVQRLLEDFGLVSFDGKSLAKGGDCKADVQADVERVCKAALERRSGSGLGMLLATDAFCLVNRARGTALVSPEEVMGALRASSRTGGSLRLRELGATGAIAVSLSRTSEAECDRKLLELASSGPLSAFRLSAEKALTAAEAQYLLRDAEARAVLVRDDAPEGVFYYRNFFSDY